MKKDIDHLLVSILNGSASREEVVIFSEWIKDYDNELYFGRFKEMWHLYMHENYIEMFDPKQEHPDLLRFLAYMRASKRRERRKTIFGYSVSAAAVVLLLIGLFNFSGPFSRNDDKDFSKLSYSNDSVKVELYSGNVVKSIKGVSGSVSDITSTLFSTGEDGVEGGSKGITADESAGNRSGFYESNTNTANAQATKKDIAVVYNSVSTPPGERAAMLLSDGSRVYLTSNSYLRYPTNFGHDVREVTLVGRAYFEVKKSDIPFIVNTSDMDIEVLGTSFDVESRTSGSSSSVILVEGSVKILSGGQVQMLVPDEQASLDRKTRKMEVKNVDSKLLTMWKDGVLIVQGQSFNELIDNLASWYGVHIIDKTSLSQREKFNGRFDREDIEAAIKAVCISAKTQYRIEDGNLILEDIR